jgi:hypothetical protein
VIERRTFLFVFSLGALSAPLAADAQPTGKVYRIGYLGAGSATVSQPLKLRSLHDNMRRAADDASGIGREVAPR